MKTIKRILSIEFLVESILVVFAIANFSTISDYFIHSGMNIVTSYSVGVLMGLILIASAMMLSRIERTAEIFNFVLYATIGAAVLAAILQTLAYHTITHDWVTSAIKGAGFPMVEVALAYSVSLYSTYLKKKEIEDADARFDEQLAIMQRNATMNLDPEKIREDVEDKMQQIIAARINKFTVDQLKKYVVDDVVVVDQTPTVNMLIEKVNMLEDTVDTLNQQLLTTQQSTVNMPEFNIQRKVNMLTDNDSQQSTTDSQHTNDTGESTSIDAYVDQHPKSTTVNVDKQQRQQQLLDLLRTVNGQPSTVLNKKQLATQLNTTDTTVNRDLKELKQQGLININGVVEVL